MFALLSFSDLAEAYVLALLTRFYDFRLAALRNIVENAKQETGLDRPLIKADLKVLFNSVVIEKPARGIRSRHMVDLAHGGRNLVFNECGVSTSFRYTLWVVASRLRNRNVRLRESCEWPPSRPTREFIAVAAFGRQLRESDALRSPTPRQSSNLGIRFLVDAFARPQHLVAA